MRSKASVLAEDISTLTEYIQFGKELVSQLNKRWGITNNLVNSSDHTINSTEVLKQLQRLEKAFQKVNGEAQGKGFEEPSDG